MCLLLISYHNNPEFPFIVAANRDEFYNRPTEKARFWKNHPDLLAGKDVEAGGTWLGITRAGRFAAITNFRDMRNIKDQAPTRGLLTLDFLTSGLSIFDYGNALQAHADEYNGYNLLLSDMENLLYFSNQSKVLQKLPPGIYGLSNHLLDTPWPKVIKSKKAFIESVSGNKISEDKLFGILSDDSQAPDDQLPDTGLDLKLEKTISPVFIKSDGYGTRSSTVIILNRLGEMLFVERSLDTETGNWTESRFSLKLNQTS